MEEKQKSNMIFVIVWGVVSGNFLRFWVLFFVYLVLHDTISCVYKFRFNNDNFYYFTMQMPGIERLFGN